MNSLEEKSHIPPHYFTSDNKKARIYYLVNTVMPSIKKGNTNLQEFVRLKYADKTNVSTVSSLLDICYCFTGIPFITDSKIFEQVYLNSVKDLAAQLELTVHIHPYDFIQVVQENNHLPDLPSSLSDYYKTLCQNLLIT